MMNPIFFIRFIHFLHHFPWVSATIVPWSLRRWSPWWHQLWRPSAQRSPHGVSAHSLDLFLVVPCYMISWAKHIQMICFEHFNINNENIIILVLLLLLLLLFLISRLLFFCSISNKFHSHISWIFGCYTHRFPLMAFSSGTRFFTRVATCDGMGWWKGRNFPWFMGF